jgi:cation diffusion facilitator CzcD-associated flavoprotein CzcO
VIGTGSSSAQLVPEVSEVAEHVYLFQRQPGWVIPKPDRDYTEAETRRLHRSGWRLRLRRLVAFVRLERMRAVARSGTRANRAMQRLAEDYLRTAVPDQSLRDLLTPDYPYFGKRPVLTKYFYPALSRSNVTVVPQAVTELTRTGVIDATGTKTDVDVVVLATGFQPSRFLATLEVTGRAGVRLRDVWDAEPKAFLGMMAVGFPNFFVTYGPNTNGGTVLFTLERQAEWIARAIARSARRNEVLDVRPSVVQAVDHLLVRRNKRFVWSVTGNNYYTSATGRVVTQWPFSQKLYWLLTRTLRPATVCVKSPRTSTPMAGPAEERATETVPEP